MKTITFGNQRYRIAFIEEDFVVVDLPEKDCYGMVSRMTIPMRQFCSRIQKLAKKGLTKRFC